MNKKNLYVSVFIALTMLGFYSYKFIEINKSAKENKFNFNIPKIVIINTKHIKTNLTKYAYVWGKNTNNKLNKKNHLKKSLNPNKLKNSSYIYKKINGVPSICMKSNIDYRWEFYGTSFKNGQYFAIFYNPAIKKISSLSKNKQLDKGLIIKKISANEVVVKHKKDVFNLRIFYFDKKQNKKEEM